MTVPVYLDADGRTVYALDGRSGRVDVGEVVEHTADGCVMVTRARLPDAVVGTVRQVPRVESVADAGALFGRRAEAVHGRGGVAEWLASEAPPLRGVAIEASTPQPDGTHLVRVKLGAPQPDLAAENAALRAALATSGELLAEAHEEVERLRAALAGGDTRSAVAVADSTPQPDGTHAATVRWPR